MPSIDARVMFCCAATLYGHQVTYDHRVESIIPEIYANTPPLLQSVVLHTIYIKENAQ